MFSKILLATTPADESKGASNLSFALARLRRSKLFIFHAYGLPEEGWSAIRYLLPSGKVEEVKKELEDYFSSQLSKIEDYEVEVVPGIPRTKFYGLPGKKMWISLSWAPQGGGNQPESGADRFHFAKGQFKGQVSRHDCSPGCAADFSGGRRGVVTTGPEEFFNPHC